MPDRDRKGSARGKGGPGGRLGFDRRVFFLSLLVGLPGSAAALGFLWLGDFTPATTWTVTLLLVGLWLGLAWNVREQVVHPLRTLANVLAAFREGDFSIRARGGGPDDSLSLAYRELNSLEEILREQRLGAVEASTLLQRVMGEIDVAVFAFDEDRRLKLLNRAGAQLIGRTEEEAIERRADELRLTEALEGPAPRTLELGHLGGSGRWEVRRRVVRQEGQRLELVVLSDLSRALREEERQAWKRLVRVLGHEINNSLAPIKSITASLRAILDRDPVPEDWESDLSRGLEVVAARADSLSRFMTAYARLARLPAPTPVSIEVAEWIPRVARLETRKEVEVRPGPEVTLRADRDQLEQALINLIRNAVDAVEETGGGVAVEWRLTSEAEGGGAESGGAAGEGWEGNRSAGDPSDIASGGGLPSRRLEIVVEDEGPGVSETTNLFVPFYTTKPDGTGIGLVLSRQIVEAHDGELTLENRPDERGARARMVLPA